MSCEVAQSISRHKQEYPEPYNQVVRDVAERYNITTDLVMKKMKEQFDKYKSISS